ncbi:hypothetical protein EDC32_10338 [Laceyella sacchari]|jgi:hypothetical protein|nr:hypothetical protein EDC32_10338 [Laceyella sacchari]
MGRLSDMIPSLNGYTKVKEQAADSVLICSFYTLVKAPCDACAVVAGRGFLQHQTSAQG